MFAGLLVDVLALVESVEDYKKCRLMILPTLNTLLYLLLIRVTQLIKQVKEEEDLHQAASDRLSGMESGRDAEITDLKAQLEIAVASSKVIWLHGQTSKTIRSFLYC